MTQDGCLVWRKCVNLDQMMTSQNDRNLSTNYLNFFNNIGPLEYIKEY